MRKITFAEAINEAMCIAMHKDKNVITFGLGVPDPKGIFGTTIGLQEKFGSERVFDTPTSENAMTGVGIGASLNGLRPVMVHQRVDFFLLAMDQLINNAAKWRFMFGGVCRVPITIRLIVGHGWGQGPTHSQNLQSMFSQIPGLKVVMPTTAYDAKGLLLESIFSDDPVIFLEHRWLHGLESDVPEGLYRIPIGKSKLMREGSDITLVSLSYMTIEALHAVDELNKIGITCDLIDLRSTSPLDSDTVIKSLSKTGRLLAIDSASESFSVASEIIARVSMASYDKLKSPPDRIALADEPSPTSFGLTDKYYFGAKEIALRVLKILGVDAKINSKNFAKKHPHDVPGDWFKGPF
ncbi:alpha-ketoacid dehydrogenase subunit beta [Candidatus Pseudothioglobus sp. Uisw_016]|uniref:alpha-ketoacid dehydrogenase subunit beta n=1 Tax=Candidatus Pseudothioglobus sp. Uisw_016 TaxID=3230995 RepID=UPI003A8BE298